MGVKIMTDITLIDVMVLAGSFACGIIIWKITKIIFICCYWAGHDTMLLALNLKKDLTYWKIIKGLIHCYFSTFTSTLFDRLDGSIRHS